MLVMRWIILLLKTNTSPAAISWTAPATLYLPFPSRMQSTSIVEWQCGADITSPLFFSVTQDTLIMLSPPCAGMIIL